MADVTLPAQWRDAIADFERHLLYERNRSANTARAYIGDVSSLGCHAVAAGHSGVADLSLEVLRGWLIEMVAAGAARRTAARRVAAARTFCAWAHKRGLLDHDVSLRLSSPKIPSTLPAVLSQG
ncbi:MAG: site-specific integrase, partial [Actinomycetales bacterium]|nr:site-specific integrase [Actinomycetales bacterium]